MCDLIALTQCCKLISYLHLIFAVLLANLKIDYFSSYPVILNLFSMIC